MTDQTKPVARPGETLVHLHFINPDTNDRSTWIGTSAHRALLRDADGRLNLEVMIDVDGETAPAPVADQQSAPDTAEGRLTDLIDRWKIDTYPAADLMPSADAMPAFLADIDTVLRDLRRERNGHIGTMQERDHATEAADRLAYAIAPVEVIGEHSSGNDPWTNALDVLQERPDLTRKALNEATALNGVHERVIARLRADLEHAKAAPGPSGLARVWSGYDDDECWFPFFAELPDAKAYAEAAYRAHCIALGNEDPGEIIWKERTAYTEDRGYPGMFDLDSEAFGAGGWVVCETLVHASLASGLAEHPIPAGDEPEPAPQIPGQTVIAVAGSGVAA